MFDKTKKKLRKENKGHEKYVWSYLPHMSLVKKKT